MTTPNIDALFDRPLDFPDSEALARYRKLVGIEVQQSAIEKLLSVLIVPSSLEEWKKTHHPNDDIDLDFIFRRPPLVILAGDVGTGKTELSETVGAHVANKLKAKITLYPLSLGTRGEGRVGQMTQLISQAFNHVYESARRLKNGDSKSGIIMLIDEADAIAQSRESEQMHHEDKSGVNAVIKGIDMLSEEQLPIAILMCTNRANALDPAIKRRACEIFEFNRPSQDLRVLLLKQGFSGFGFNDTQIEELAKITGSNGDNVGFTCSDISQRFVPAVIMECYPDKPVSFDAVKIVLKRISPTPTFKEMQ